MKKKGFIFDVDGVIADTPHEEAWRESLHLLLTERDDWKLIRHKTNYSLDKFTTDLYRKEISGKPRTEGARSVLKYFNVPDPNEKYVNEYCEFKQKIFSEKIEQGEFKVYDDAILFLLEAKQKGGKLAAASSSKNANQILEKIDIGEYIKKDIFGYSFTGKSSNLLSLFDGNVCGIDLHQGKPNPEIFIKAAESIGINPEDCVVIEDAVSGVIAAINGNFYCIGIARLNNEAE
ncbi:MAG TPA: HAD-IA family hydrolase, partial [Ignavibacteriaceae bacterium]|nr:HAD-IA family hydrolase [Ignavibacteriaceae bacterium]